MANVVFECAKGDLVLSEWEVEDIIRWYKRELRRMDQPGTRYTEWHRRDYARTVADYETRLAEARRPR